MLPWQNTTAHNEREASITAWQEGRETVAGTNGSRASGLLGAERRALRG